MSLRPASRAPDVSRSLREVLNAGWRRANATGFNLRSTALTGEVRYLPYRDFKEVLDAMRLSDWVGETVDETDYETTIAIDHNSGNYENSVRRMHEFIEEKNRGRTSPAFLKWYKAKVVGEEEGHILVEYNLAQKFDETNFEREIVSRDRAEEFEVHQHDLVAEDYQKYFEKFYGARNKGWWWRWS